MNHSFFITSIDRAASNYELWMFNTGALMYGLSTIAYFAFIIIRKKPVWAAGFLTAIIGCLAETIALGLRWYQAGWDHPPFTNMYESLVFFAWGIVLFYLILEIKYKIRLAGVLIIPMAFATMGLASLSPDKSIAPLVPALQSIWLHLHVAIASIGYAAFLAAFGVSLLYLIKDRLSFFSMFMTCSVINVVGLLAVTKGKAASFGFDLTAVKMVNNVPQKLYIPGTDPPMYEQVSLPLAGIFVFLTILGYVIAAFVSANAKHDNSGKAFGNRVFAFAVPTILLSMCMIVLIYNFVTNPVVSLSANPYSFGLIAVLWFFSVLLLTINQVHDSFASMLPKAAQLDELAYRTIMIAFPIMTLIIVTGAIWANQAWGRYWGWDPKETASLVTWIIYLIYLHTRFTKGWKGRRTAYISIIGFVSVVFTYLGVNLLLSGLHAYATG